MCGIVGIVDAATLPRLGDVRHALDLMRHRGPDGEGTWSRDDGGPPFVVLGHKRLAIIDLTDAGAQPMGTVDRSLWITYNGELYNYLELRARLEGLGRVFRSDSDTEVILQAYEEWGRRSLDSFNGMFAFAIWDERRRTLFAARDRFGEKPFHYSWDAASGRFAFASEIKALLSLPTVSKGLDDRALYRFIRFRELAASDQTLWADVRRLRHAHWLELSWVGDRFTLSTAPYWDVDLDHREELSREEAASRFRELFADSVRLRLRSDVAVGTSLSGGLDSSSVICQIQRLGAAEGQKAFSARMEDPELDEGRHIRRVLQATGIPGYEVWPSAEELERLFSRLCYALEEPFPTTSQFAQHLVMRLASEHGVTVLLDGQGADELLAGYRPYFFTRYLDLASGWRLAALGRELLAFRRRHGQALPLSAKAVAARLAPSLHRRYRGARDVLRGLDGTGAGAPWSREWLRLHADEPPPALPAARRDLLTRKLYADALDGNLQELLRYGDRNSMAWSREVRQPFLDHRLGEFVFALGPQAKISGGQSKVVLRDAMRALVPDEILGRQDKLGYQPPFASWLGGPLSSWLSERADDLHHEIRRRMVGDPIPGDRSVGLQRDLNETFRLVVLSECLEQMDRVGSERPCLSPESWNRRTATSR